MYDTMISSFASVARGYVQGSLEKASADTNNRINEANATNGNKVRGASNAFAAARGALARYMQSVNNNNRLDAGGEALEANLVNARRREDALQSAGFEAMVRNTEQQGAQAAAAAFAGVGGGVADMVSASTRLMQQRASQAALQARDTRLYDTSRRAYAIQSQTIRGLDSSMILDSLDYTVNVAQKEHAVNPWMRAIIAGGDAWIDGKGFYDDKNNRTGTTQARSEFRQSEISSERGDSYEPDTRDYAARWEFNDFGTGSEYGNDDYGNYL